jgi:hypothetical protein
LTTKKYKYSSFSPCPKKKERDFEKKILEIKKIDNFENVKIRL